MAISDYTMVLLLDSANVATIYNRGNAYKFQHKYRDALKDYSLAISLNPGLAGAWRERGDVYLTLFKYDSAKNDFERALRIDPKDTVSLNNRGLVFYNQRRFDLALADYNEVLRLDPRNLNARNNRGNVYYQQGKFDEALNDYNEILKQDPSNTEALDNRGNLYFTRKKIDLAIKDYNEALRIKPGFTNALNNRGNAWLEQGNEKLALADYKKILTINPQNLVAFFNLGNLYYKKGVFDSTLWYANEALQINPEYAEALNLRAVANYAQGNLEQAVASVQQALAINPQLKETLNTRGMIYAYLGQYDSALYFYNQALRYYPEFTDVLNNRGLVYYNMGQHELAITDYLKALKADPDNSRIMINLMLTFIAGDELEKAAQQYALYRQKNLSGYMEANAAFSFLKKYISACIDYVRVKDYQKALPLLTASLEEYKQSNQDKGTNRMLAYEYANVIYRTAWVLEQLQQQEKALDYYKKAQIMNPRLEGITARIEKLNGHIAQRAEKDQLPPEIKLLTPAIVSGTTIQKENTPDLFVSGVVKDLSGIQWVKVNGADVASVDQSGYFSVSIKNTAPNLTIQAAGKKGLISSATYQWQQQQQQGNNANDAFDIKPLEEEKPQAFHAVLIACSNYSGKWSKLSSTIDEAKQYKKLLTTRYGFKEENILELYDKEYIEILSGLYGKLQSLGEQDNLVILYAGHGTYRQTGTELIGYWVPLNAMSPEIDYISNKKLDELLSGSNAKHILMMSDACYSATMRGGGLDNEKTIPQKHEFNYKSRQIFTSGGVEKVPEQSVFIRMVMKTLEQNEEKYLSVKVLYNLIFNGVKNQTNNEPELNKFGKDGNEGGQFYFIRAK